MITKTYWLYIVLAFWMSGIIFTLPMERKEKFGWRLFAGAGVMLAFSLLIFYLPWGGFVIKDAIFMLGGCIILCVSIHGGWEVSWSIACYNTV